MRWFQTPLALLLTLAFTTPSAAQTFPDYVSTTVNDFADLLPEADERTLSERLSPLERNTGVEMTLVTLATQSFFAPTMSLEDFATALFDEWGVGKAAAVALVAHSAFSVFSFLVILPLIVGALT